MIENIYLNASEAKYTVYQNCLLLTNSAYQMKDKYIDWNVLSVNPNYMSNCENYVVIDFILNKFFEANKGYAYIDGGARNIRHKTNMQNYLCTFFGFRFAYMVIKMEFKLLPHIATIISYPFRNIFKKSKNKLLYNLGCMLKMYEYSKKNH